MPVCRERLGTFKVGAGNRIADDGHHRAGQIGARLQRRQIGQRAVEAAAVRQAGILDDGDRRVRRQAGLDQPPATSAATERPI